uniref:NADH-ubiquinone oxidoreductase chain 3 n=1 Tax=Phlebotomus chinensis TaxID=641374 RepID=A0A0N9DSP6_9DIPT|nr:NADH dehydrogenase subunit 3 [Phlebotomus chinensis]YP_011009216.1 NADH dehydrogenase subunit 3 [Phlebotomus sichuanensis]ALF07241.1 NADH dehydrogenase subunit 3 [Phlebotomus chinensis]WPV76907.1 NADH dehydrogenase subunit 3 [Phlebotomus sichuanensis]WPV76920.1 NADH dehydrogenase subunit 3 [Phlebotomus sichuanensis]WPV76933.1 NADH dehydrogenase subunit 3 [Phlebotomus sichuanensis]WPV76946.1 NADH dehydrogenase subunit 3 [Phlebotomus sichuanensis]
MLSLLNITTIIFLISSIVMLLASFLSKKTIIDREKSSPFECGFDPKTTSRIPFSLQFYLIGIIFLIFDIEIALLLPMILSFQISNIFPWLMTSLLFLLILIIGLFHEWYQGALNWSI